MKAKKKPLPVSSRTGAANEYKVEAKFSAKSTATEKQRERILRALRRRPQTTETLRQIGIFQVASRIKELRDRFGYEIETVRVTVIDRESYDAGGDETLVQCLGTATAG